MEFSSKVINADQTLHQLIEVFEHDQQELNPLANYLIEKIRDDLLTAHRRVHNLGFLLNKK